MIKVGGIGADNGEPVDDAPDAVDERKIKRRRSFFLPGSNNRLMIQTTYCQRRDVGVGSRGRKSDVSISLSGKGGC